MIMKSGLMAAALAAALSFALPASAVTINGPHAALPCTTCHTGTQMKAPAKDKCFECHGSYEQIAERTAKLTPKPHSSHRGEANCTACHSMHAKSRFECNDCHNFSIKMKGE